MALDPLLFLCLLPAFQEIRVHEAVRGCFGGSERNDVWTLRGDAFVLGQRRVPIQTVESIRRLVLLVPEEPLDADALLASVGVTPASLIEHRNEILAVAMPPGWEGGVSWEALQPYAGPLLTWERLRDPMAREVVGQNWNSTTGFELDVTLPGDPEVVLSSRGEVPWMLPWKITAGARTWSSSDVAISKALLPMVAPDGPTVALLDGAQYWRKGFWSDSQFWGRWLGSDLDAALAKNEYTTLDGYPVAVQFLRVEKVMTGCVNMQPLAMFFHLASRYPAAIDEIRWWNLIEEERTTSTWDDVLDTWRQGIRAVEREAWIGAWKSAGQGRTVGLDVVGAHGVSESMLEMLVLPAWHDAGFEGEPDFELILRREGKACATVFLARGKAGALITFARPGEGDHAVDRLQVSFHPRAKPPTYALVDTTGRIELRTLR